MSRQGRCGCSVVSDDGGRHRYPRSLFLPQVSVKCHTSIMASTFRTTLTQTFVNPHKESSLDEIVYTFPLYDGVCVVGFDCEIDGRVIQGVVKERRQAKAEYTKAKEKGQTAGLMSQSLSAGDVFTTNLGNIPAAARINVEITYLGELKHDAETDGLRYTMPWSIAPRYGADESFQAATDVVSAGMSICVDAEMTSAIKSVDSPSHAVSVNIGTTSAHPGAEPTFNKASASLSTDVSALDADFVLRVMADSIGEPTAVLETHTTMPNQRALMATLVPKFTLPLSKPEFVFVCDRSGSMGSDDKIASLRRSLHTFLKSLPVGCKFNICSFGSHHSFLWPRSRTYDQDSLQQASAHLEAFEADFGGTQMYEPMEDAFHRRFTDLDLEVFLLTDGDIWSQEKLCRMIQDHVAKSDQAIRVFTLGIGSDCSSSLVEKVARAGNGFSQVVLDSDKMEKKAVRMLKAARTPHVKDYTMELLYEDQDADDFVLVEKIQDSLRLDVPSPKSEPQDIPKEPISLYNKDTAAEEADTEDTTEQDHLPEVPSPSYLQAPHDIPPLFPFNRTSVYVLMSGKSAERVPKALMLRGTSKQGPLELKIDINQPSHKDTMIHQLAARKAILDLEDGRGWLTKATNDSGKLLSEGFQSRFSDMIEREAVRLGVKFQVGGKWSSFVAVEWSVEDGQEEAVRPTDVPQPCAPVQQSWMGTCQTGGGKRSARTRCIDTRSDAPAGMLFGGPSKPTRLSTASSGVPPPPPSPSPWTPSAGAPSRKSGGRPLSTSKKQLLGNPGSSAGGSASLCGGPVSHAARPKSSAPRFGSVPGRADPKPTGSVASGYSAGSPVAESHVAFGSASGSPGYSPTSPRYSPASPAEFREHAHEEDGDGSGPIGLVPGQDVMGCASAMHVEDSDSDVSLSFDQAEPPTPEPTRKPLESLVYLQGFNGAWSWGRDLERVLCLTDVRAREVLSMPAGGCKMSEDEEACVRATALVLMYLRLKLKEEEETWEMLAEKARAYVEETTGCGIEEIKLKEGASLPWDI